MKKIMVLLFGLVLLPLFTQASEFKEGVNYKVINQPETAQPQVMEFFSYYCPHCYRFQPIIAKLKASLGKKVSFKQNHIDFLGGAMGAQLTRALAAAQILEVEDKFTSLVFDTLHVKHQQINGEKGILELFAKLNISPAKAKGALESFSSAGIASQMKRNTEKFKINGVPTLIVNGKYQVITGSVNNVKDLIGLVEYLTHKKN
ncbi:MAG: thiol:disulfide interchange protein DsbA/DsbL [Psychromonas sp.]|nr:thiol:disulfide interchange protein DsbA/DsbL [Psychromonas sp.]